MSVSVVKLGYVFLQKCLFSGVSLNFKMCDMLKELREKSRKRKQLLAQTVTYNCKFIFNIIKLKNVLISVRSIWCRRIATSFRYGRSASQKNRHKRQYQQHG